MNRFRLLCAVLGACVMPFALLGCNTLQGAGKDIQVVGGAVRSAGEETQDLVGDVVETNAQVSSSDRAADYSYDRSRVQTGSSFAQAPAGRYDASGRAVTSTQQDQGWYSRGGEGTWTRSSFNDQQHTFTTTRQQPQQQQRAPFAQPQQDLNRFAGNQPTPGQRYIGAADRGPTIESALNVLGSNVTTARGQQVGTLQDLVMDAGSGRVQYGVVSVWGDRDQLYVAPWSDFSQGRGQSLVLHTDLLELRSGPSFAANNHRALQDPQLYREAGSYYGVRSVGQSTALSQLIGTEIRGRGGEGLGEIEDVLVDLDQGNAEYLRMSLSQQGGEQMATVPWDQLQLQQRAMHSAMISADQQTLQQVARSDRQQGINRGYLNEVDRQFRSGGEQVFGFVEDGQQGQQNQQGQGQQLSGTIVSIGTATAYGQPDMVRLRLHRDDGGTVTAISSARELVDGQGVRLQAGDRIILRGQPQQLNGREIFIGEQIQRAGMQQQGERQTTEEQRGQPPRRGIE